MSWKHETTLEEVAPAPAPAQAGPLEKDSLEARGAPDGAISGSLSSNNAINRPQRLPSDSTILPILSNSDGQHAPPASTGKAIEIGPPPSPARSRRSPEKPTSPVLTSALSSKANESETEPEQAKTTRNAVRAPNDSELLLPVSSAAPRRSVRIAKLQKSKKSNQSFMMLARGL